MNDIKPDPAASSDGTDAPPSGPVIIGLTGPIGCGKSTVGGMLAELGAVVVDADQLARVATAPGEPAVAAIRERFGEAVFVSAGVLDRSALASVVFSEPTALRDLETIVHPRVHALIDAAVERARQQGDPLLAIEAIKLVEGGLADRCDEILLIECPAATQRRRLLGRGMDSDDIERRIGAQGEDFAERLAARSDRRIDTSGSRASLRECVEDALAEVLSPRFAGLPWGPVERR